jgi:hypothetical protein
MFFIPRNVNSIFRHAPLPPASKHSGSEQLVEFDCGETRVSLKYAGSRTRKTDAAAARRRQLKSRSILDVSGDDELGASHLLDSGRG